MMVLPLVWEQDKYHIVDLMDLKIGDYAITRISKCGVICNGSKYSYEELARRLNHGVQVIPYQLPQDFVDVAKLVGEDYGESKIWGFFEYGLIIRHKTNIELTRKVTFDEAAVNKIGQGKYTFK